MLTALLEESESFICMVKLLSNLVFFQAWTTLGRAQLNFGEPDSAIRSFESALSINVSSTIKIEFFTSSISLFQ